MRNTDIYLLSTFSDMAVLKTCTVDLVEWTEIRTVQYIWVIAGAYLQRIHYLPSLAKCG
jgi:hypothetical protein